MNKRVMPLQIFNTNRYKIKFVTGFTLIEVLLAIFILGLGMVTSFNLFPVGLQSLSYARRLNEVYFLAEKKMEDLNAEDIDAAMRIIEGTARSMGIKIEG